ncbi:minor tail protein [Proteus phage 309]|uniref:Minor tail protein n=1 Tax=Proteus phage 309 TaxID=2894355 RepID=A0AAE8YHS7_9CAUD|nr:minor tail protein [Proteus phage 309]
MNVLKDNLIKILEQNDVDVLCSNIEGECHGVYCEECPFDSAENKQQLIKELQND